MKHLLLKCLESKEDFFSALLEWRNVPRSDGFSPAQMFLGRRQRSLLPALPQALAPVDQEQAHLSRQLEMGRTSHYYNSKAKPLQVLNINDTVLVQDHSSKKWQRQAKILGKSANGRTYALVSNGKHFVRNRRFLRPVTSVTSLPPPPMQSSMQSSMQSPSMSPDEPTSNLRRSERLEKKMKKNVRFNI
jgi:hypothetical protein